MGVLRGLHRCPACDKVFYGQALYCSMRCKWRHHEKTRTRTVELREATKAERARKRRAKASLSAYRHHRKLRRVVNAPSPEERRLKHNAYMLAKYYADPDNWSTRRRRLRIFEADGWRCQVCGVKVSDSLPSGHPRKAIAMHIVARSTGGEWTRQNMTTGCHRCNVADGVNRIPIQTNLSNL